MLPYGNPDFLVSEQHGVQNFWRIDMSAFVTVILRYFLEMLCTKGCETNCS